MCVGLAEILDVLVGSLRVVSLGMHAGQKQGANRANQGRTGLNRATRQ
jgi:hypothetical protein